VEILLKISETRELDALETSDALELGDGSDGLDFLEISDIFEIMLL